MKIATWNLERPTNKGRKNPGIIEYLQKINADILILTETNESIDLGSEYFVFHTLPFKANGPKEGERRVSILSKYPLAENKPSFETFDAETAICINLQTPLDVLTVYGTIIGVTGNKGDQFKSDLDKQLSDFDLISGQAENVCISGDLNMTFSDNYYFTKKGREKLKASFKKNGLINYTAGLCKNMDHIILPGKFTGERKTMLSQWNDQNDKANVLSDHIGVMLEIFE